MGDLYSEGCGLEYKTSINPTTIDKDGICYRLSNCETFKRINPTMLLGRLKSEEMCSLMYTTTAANIACVNTGKAISVAVRSVCMLYQS